MTRSSLALGLAAAVAAGCAERADPVAPPPVAATPRAVADSATGAPPMAVQFADVVERVAPALGDSPEAADVRAALRAAIPPLMAGTGARGPVAALRSALERLAQASPELAAEVDAVRLALAPAEARAAEGSATEAVPEVTGAPAPP